MARAKPDALVKQSDWKALNSPRCQFTPTGLIIAEDMPFEEWLELGDTLHKITKTVLWWWGDWLHYGEGRGVGQREWGEAYKRGMQSSGYEYDALTHAVLVCKAFEVWRRRQSLPFNFHREVCVLPENYQEEVLGLAEDDAATGNRWSYAKLRAVVREYKFKLRNPDGIEQGAFIDEASCFDWLADQPPCDLLITDPPYSTDIDNIEDFAASWLPRALDTVKPTGRAYICIGAYPREITAYLDVVARFDLPLTLQQVLVWEYRNTMGPTPKFDYFLNWQAILYFRGPEAPELTSPNLIEQCAVQDIPAPQGAGELRLDAWQKPDKLAERFIKHSTKAGDMVLDPFAGTGTFVLAAARLGRLVRGCELDPEMINKAILRGCNVHQQSRVGVRPNKPEPCLDDGFSGTAIVG
jgi:hypothetical protein